MISKIKKVKLKELCLHITDGEHASVLDDLNGNYYLLSNKNIIDGNIICCDSDRKINYQTFNKINGRTKLEGGDLLISTVGTLGKTAVVPKEFNYTFQRSVGIIKTDKKLLNEYYIKYLFDTPKYQKLFKVLSKGAIQKCIFIDDLKNLEIDIFDLSYQNKIVAFLKTIDDKIDLNNKCISKLEQMMKDIYDYWFVQFDFPNEKGKPYKSSGGKMMYNEKLKREIPAIFEIKTVEDFCDIFTGKKDVNKSLDNGKYKFFSCAPEFRYSNEYLYDGKAILVSGNGSYTGRTIFVNDKFDLYQRTYAIVNKDDAQDIIEYIYLSLKTYFVLKVKGGTHGSAIPYIVYNDIANEPILYNKEIIMKFIDIVKQLLQKIVAIKNQNDKLKEYKNFVLPLLMNGQVEVK